MARERTGIAGALHLMLAPWALAGVFHLLEYSLLYLE